MNFLQNGFLNVAIRSKKKNNNNNITIPPTRVKSITVLT